MATPVHHIAGRLRLRIPAMARSAERAEKLRQRLIELAGVTKVEANPRANCVVVVYDPAVLDATLIVAHLRGIAEHRPVSTPGAKAALLPPQVAAQAVTFGAMFGKALFDAVLHKGVERSIKLLVGR